MFKVKSVGVVGAGVVGKAIARSYLGFCEVRTYDVELLRATHSLPDALRCDVVFVCLPTPTDGGSNLCDTSAVEAFFKETRELFTVDERVPVLINLVLKSTVPVGFTRRMANLYNMPNLVHSPEFLNSRTAYLDAAMPNNLIIGGRTPACSEDGAVALHSLYAARFPNVGVRCMAYEESELTKLAVNGFFAVKVAYWNEISRLCEGYEVRWDAVRAAALDDGRIHPSHTQVPGPDGKPGFGGACLPKDLVNLIECEQKVGLQPVMTAAAQYRNSHDRPSAQGDRR